jgi:hypothetical protein
LIVPEDCRNLDARGLGPYAPENHRRLSEQSDICVVSFSYGLRYRVFGH